MSNYDIARWLIAGLFRTTCRPTVTGLANFPESGPVIVASNHRSFVDSVVISALMPRRVAFFAKAEYVNTRGLKGRIMKGAFTWFDVIPVNRSARAESVKALRPAEERLQEGGVFGIYPEGTRSRDGRLYRGKAGVAYLALKTGAPILPIGLRGTERLQPSGNGLIRPARFSIAIGRPIEVEAKGDAQHGRERRELVETVMSSIAALSGQERADRYNVSPSLGKDGGS